MAAKRQGRQAKTGKLQKGSKSLSTVERIHAAIREMTINYEFRPNASLNESELAARLNVSRTPLREALSRLVTEGLLQFYPNRGFFPRDLDDREVLDLYEVRSVLEGLAYELACERAGDDGIRQLRRYWESCRENYDTLSSQKLALRDEEFHVRLAKLSGNAQLLSMLESINARIRFIRVINLEILGKREPLYDEHLGIVAALEKRDRSGGRRKLEAHMRLSVADAIASTKEGLARIHLRRRAS